MKVFAKFVSQISLAYQNKVAAANLFLNLTLPIQLAYAKDSALHSLAADEHAHFYYSGGCIEPTPLIHRAKVYLKGYIEGLFTKQIPQYFIDEWFAPVDSLNENVSQSAVYDYGSPCDSMIGNSGSDAFRDNGR